MKCKIVFVFLLLLLLFLTGCRQHREDEDLSLDSNIISEQNANPSKASITEAQQIANNECATIVEIAPIAFRGGTWQEVYQQIILSNPQNYLMYVDRTSTLEDRWLYLGIKDFNSDDVPELVIGDSCSAAVFTFVNGEALKLANLCIPDLVWCINGLYVRGNSVSVQCNGAGGSNFVNFGFCDNEYVIGIYTELCNDYNPPHINGVAGTLEQMNRIYPTDYTSFSKENRKAKVRLAYEGEQWDIHFPSGETLPLDESFDFKCLLWK